ncbi:MAG: hypothetical protein M1828_002155 [Chrysothrix sp. TS-e1954]|nr:MAG: hypothetical protein M1828_002155 [Chrysothrix sp. TS-e1954]
MLLACLLRCFLCLYTYLSVCTAVDPDDEPSNIFHFKTEPQFESPRIFIDTFTRDAARLSAGYIFLAPYGIYKDDVAYGYGPHIYDVEGQLVWNGHEWANIWFGDKHARSMDFSVCDYLGSFGDHLCWSDITVEDRWVVATNRIFNSSYEQVAGDFSSVANFTKPNEHEFRTIRNGFSFLQIIYDRKPTDLTAYAGTEDGCIVNPCFQEVDVSTGDELFKWCHLDHASFDDTYIYMNVPGNTVNATGNVAGKGLWEHPWDLSHMNAVSVNDEGDYIVSVRHFDTVYKLAGLNNVHGLETGDIIWQIGGKNPNMLLSSDAHFSRQHDASAFSTTCTGSSLLLLDNASEGRNDPSADNSSAVILSVNNQTNEVVLQNRYIHPNGSLSIAEGSARLLSNLNVFVSWGKKLPEFTEYASDGQVLWHARMLLSDTFSYRVFKYPWIGHPPHPPKLLAYRQRTAWTRPDLPLYAYVSWNGATEVRSWRFFISNGTAGPWQHVGTYPKDGFETKVELQSAPPGTDLSVEALDQDDKILGEALGRVFVPSWSVRNKCAIDGCEDGFLYAPSDSCDDHCGRLSWSSVIFGLAFCIALVESAVYFGGYMLAAPSSRDNEPSRLPLEAHEELNS